jgi:hypothetical protein
MFQWSKIPLIGDLCGVEIASGEYNPNTYHLRGVLSLIFLHQLRYLANR